MSRDSRYGKFCALGGRVAFPATEATLLLFVSKLYQDGLAPGTIKSYLAAVRFGNIRRGLGNPQLHLIPQLEYALKGVKRLSTKQV